MRWNLGRYDLCDWDYTVISLQDLIFRTMATILRECLKRQIATYNTALSVENFKAAMAVPAALGLDPSIANSGISLLLKFGFSLVLLHNQLFFIYLQYIKP